MVNDDVLDLLIRYYSAVVVVVVVVVDYDYYTYE